MRDYNIDPIFSDRRRKRGRPALLLAALIVAGGALAVYLEQQQHFTQQTQPEPVQVSAEHAPAPTISEPLALPLKNTRTPPLDTAPIAAAVEPPLQQAPVAAPGLEPATQPSLIATTANDREITALIEQPEPPAPRNRVPSKAALPVQAMPPAAEQAPDPQAAHSIAETDLPMPAQPRWESHTIASGDSLARIFKTRGLSPSLLHRIVNSSDLAGSLARIRPGQQLKFQFEDQDLLQLVLVKSPVESLHIHAMEEGFDAELISKDLEKRIANATGTIESSLFADAQTAGMDDAQIMELAELFGWDIDFALEIRAGDQFRVIYEEQYLDGEKYRNGPILAAEFVNQGKTYTAFRFEDSKGNVGYYNDEGRNKRRAFIRTPIKFARISSRFSGKRWHPVLKRWRSHKGVDYAAPRGTPIKATGAGKVVFRGRKGGYGNVVIVQHGSAYQTLYAHMSKFASKARSGRKVKQGQIIGYVGSTGLATGPHLHYEFRVNGVHRNPLTVKLPKSLPLPKQELAAFKQHTKPLLAQLADIRQATMVASNP